MARTLVDQQRAACQTWLVEQQAQAEGLHDSQPYDWLVHEFRISQTKAMLAWLDTCQQTLSGPIT